MLLKVEELVNFKTVAGPRHHHFQTVPDLCFAGVLTPCSLEVSVDLLKNFCSQLLLG